MNLLPLLRTESQIIVAAFEESAEKLHSPDSATKGKEYSRLALKKSLELLGYQNLDENPGPDEAYLGIRGMPQVRASLSHTGKLAITWVTKSSCYQSVGIDVEFADRDMKDGAGRHFINESDRIKRTLLEIWNIKEAIFKCLDPLGAAGEKGNMLVLKDIVISEDKAWSRFMPSLVASWSSEKLDLGGRSCLVAKAWVEP